MKLFTTLSTVFFITLSSCSEKKSVEHEQQPAKEESKQETKQILSQHDHGDLDRFGMGEMKFEGLDFQQAINQLITKYQAICEDTGEQALAISLKVTGNPDSKPTLLLGGSFNYILSQLCTLYGMEIKVENNSEYHFSAIPREGDITTAVEIFLPNADIVCSVTELQKLFNTTISHNIASSTMTVKGQDSDVARFQKYAENLRRKKSVQIKTTTKLLRIPFEMVSKETATFLAKGAQLTDAQARVMMRELSAIKNTDIMTMPSIVSRFEEPATIEIIRELYHAENKSDNWIGLKLKVDSDYSGLKLKTDLEFECRHIEGMNSLGSTDIEGLKYDESTKIQRYKTPHHFKIKPGMTTMLKINSPANSKGTTNYIMITQTIIDMTGQTLNIFQSQK